MDDLAIKFNEEVTKYTQRDFIDQLRTIEDGREFKNWKELMDYMGEPYVNDRQLKEFQNKTSYYAAIVKTDGRRFKVYPIRNDDFNIPLPLASKELNLLVQAVLISVIRHNLKSNNRNIQCSKKALALACGMVGSQFYMYANQQGRLKHESYEELYLEEHPECKDSSTGKKKKGTVIDIPEEQSYEISTLVAEYYESMLGKVRYHVESAIKSLAHNDLIMYEEIYYIIEREEMFVDPKCNDFGDAEYVREIQYKPGRIRKATDEEIQQRLDVYAAVMKELGYQSVDDIPPSMRYKYHDLKTKRANQEMKIWGFFKGYNINTTADIEYCYQTIMQKVSVISTSYLAKGEASIETAKRQAVKKYHNGFANNSASDFMDKICRKILNKTFFIGGQFDALSVQQKYFELGMAYDDEDDLDKQIK